MTKKYLPDQTLFKCNMNLEQIPFRCRKGGKATVNGSGLLTTSASGSPPAGTHCNSPNKPPIGGVPQPCTCKLSDSWWNVAANCEVEGKAALLENSYRQCLFGGKIEVFKIIPQHHVSTGAESVTITPASDVGPAPKKQSFSTSTPAAGIAGAVASIQAADTSLQDSQIAADAQNQLTARPRQSEANKEEPSANDILTKMLCSGECSAEKRAHCGYYLDYKRRMDSQVTVNNKSQLLAENYAAATATKRDTIDEHYYQLKSRYGNRYWSYAAHHIISGNQVFKQQTELVRLADFLHYDINNAKNCIYLVSKEEGYGAIQQEKRKISAYDAMSLAQLQWHVGGHQYTFAKEELPLLRQLVTQKCHLPAAEIRSYADLLQEEIADFAVQLREEQRCWYSEESKQQKRLQVQFSQRMNEISQRIRQKLGAFLQNPAASYPYYVSKEAYRYAFTLPKTGKIIIVRRKVDNDLVLHKYRISWPAARNTSNENGLDRMKMVPVYHQNTAAEFILQPLENNEASQQNQKNCIVFCENIVYFLFVNIDFSLRLPFLPDFTRVITADTLEEIASDEVLLAAEKRQTELRTWLRDEPVPHYLAPLAVIHQRLEEWEKKNG